MRKTLLKKLDGKRYRYSFQLILLKPMRKSLVFELSIFRARNDREAIKKSIQERKRLKTRFKNIVKENPTITISERLSFGFMITNPLGFRGLRNIELGK